MSECKRIRKRKNMKTLLHFLGIGLLAIASARAGLPADEISPASFRGLVSGHGTWVAVDAHGRLVTSSDRTRWTFQATESTFALYAVAFGNGRFVAVGN